MFATDRICHGIRRNITSTDEIADGKKVLFLQACERKVLQDVHLCIRVCAFGIFLASTMLLLIVKSK